MPTATLPRKSNPPYWLGILCLIPLVGAFVGLGLLLYGLIRYKDKWLSMIGAAGILFTVFIYGSLFYAMQHANVFQKGFADISQMQLNSLVKNVEFYKLQHGQYPDSLQQLLHDDQLAPIADPIQISRQTRTPSYNYQLIGCKYLLYSSGQDGIPNTADDLFPRIALIDSTRIGWIRTR